MLLSAVSIAFVLSGDSQVQQAQDVAAWQNVQKSVAILMRDGVPFGQAALIDKTGLFLAGALSELRPQIEAKLADGRVVRLTWRAMDVATQTVLLKAESWTPDMGTVVTLHQTGEPLKKLPVLVVLANGPIRGELVADNRLGILGANTSRRMFPLGEVHFEAHEQSLAGALVFDRESHLVGILNSTLESKDSVRVVKVPSPRGGSALQTTLQSEPASQKAFGPADQTVGLTVSPEVLRRVVTGFLSPSHKVVHPAIGIFCKDAPGTGALVQQVSSGSPAAKAGLQPGDIIVKMDDKVIQNQFDFARFMDGKDVGDTITIVVMRDLVSVTLKVAVGSAKAE